MTTRRSTAGSERGAAFIEFLVTFPFLLILLMGITDLGVALSTQLTLARITYEGARFAAGLPQLEKKQDGSFVSSSEVDHYRTFRQVKQRIDTLLLRAGYNISELPADYLMMRRETDSTSALAGMPYDLVQVRLNQIPFTTVFPLLRPALPHLSTDVRGVYLFPGG